MNPLARLDQWITSVIANIAAAHGPPVPPPRPVTTVHIPTESPLLGEGFGPRQEAALRMMDDDCYGFLLLTVHKREGAVAEIHMAEHLNETWWPALADTLERLAAEVPR